MIELRPLRPWTPETRRAVSAVAHDLADGDKAEIFAMRPRWHVPESIVRDISRMIDARLLMDGYVAYDLTGQEPVPFAVVMAFVDSIPKVANVALFGRKGHKRAVVALYREIARRKQLFAAEHGMLMARIVILSDHRAAMRKARELGGEIAYELGPVGRDGQCFTQTIWRFDDGVS